MNVHSMYSYLHSIIFNHTPAEKLNEALSVLNKAKAAHMDALQPSPAPAWQPIATAPKDGTILGFTDMGWVVACRWRDDDEWSGGGVWIAAHGHVTLTHWQPLPAPPADEVDTGKAAEVTG